MNTNITITERNTGVAHRLSDVLAEFATQEFATMPADCGYDAALVDWVYEWSGENEGWSWTGRADAELKAMTFSAEQPAAPVFEIDPLGLDSFAAFEDAVSGMVAHLREGGAVHCWAENGYSSVRVDYGDLPPHVEDGYVIANDGYVAVLRRYDLMGWRAHLAVCFKGGMENIRPQMDEDGHYYATL